jgi:hypothetical protein
VLAVPLAAILVRLVDRLRTTGVLDGVLDDVAAASVEIIRHG